MTTPRTQLQVSKCARSAFTLIELLVVVAIIALLISILIPSLAIARDKAKSTVCLANTQDMGKGIHMFAAGHRGRFQVFAGLNTTSAATAATDRAAIGDPSGELFAYEGGLPPGSIPNMLSWSAVLAKESSAGKGVKKNADWGVLGFDNAYAARSSIRRFEQLVCPADKVGIGGSGAPSVLPAMAPASPQQPWYYGHLSYVINLDIVGVFSSAGMGVWKDGVQSKVGGPGEHLAGKLDKVIRPGEVAMLVDGGMSTTAMAAHRNSAMFSMHFGTSGGGQYNPRGPLLEYVSSGYMINEESGKLRPDRHNKGTLNVTFADGHGASTRKMGGNPFNPTGFEASAGTYAYLPPYQYLPKVRVTPYNSGTYPKP